MLNATVKTKGGEGGTTLANNVISYLTTALIVREIDNNNNSHEVYTKSKIKFKSVSTSGKDITKTLSEAGFFASDEEVIVDAGGGDDSLKVIEAIKASGEEVRWYLPHMPNRKTIQNLENTFEAVKGTGKTTLILNNFHDLESQFWYIFGDEDRGVEPNPGFFNPFDEVLIAPYSNLFDFAEDAGMTLYDLHLMYEELFPNIADLKKEWKKEGLEGYMRKDMQWRLMCDANDYLANQVQKIKG